MASGSPARSGRSRRRRRGVAQTVGLGMLTVHVLLALVLIAYYARVKA